MTDVNSLLIVGSLLAVGAIAMVVYLVTPRDVKVTKADFQQTDLRGKMGSRRAEFMQKYPIYRTMIPYITFFGKLHAKLGRKDYYPKMQKKLNAAGNPGAFSPDDIAGLRVVGAIIMPFIMWFFLTAMAVMQDSMMQMCLLGSVFGMFYPTIWINDIMARRQKNINIGLPYSLDLLTLSVEAGLDFIGAIDRIVRKKKEDDPLGDELYQVLQELKMGKTRKEALKDMGIRCQNENLDAVISSLIQADQLGTSIGPVLRIQSEMLRVRRSQRAEKLALEAPVKMMFPLLFIFSSVFLLMFGPTIVRALRGELI
jgi:tight adherence protein C